MDETYKNNKNIDYAKAVFEEIISLRGKLKDKSYINNKYNRYYHRHTAEILQKRKDRRKKQKDIYFL